jgi:hypothetical protein
MFPELKRHRPEEFLRQCHELRYFSESITFHSNPLANVESSQAKGANWVQNTDGSDTYQAKNILYENWVYQGGDDCIAFKPNSTGITLRNITCMGGSGIAFGSIGQYPGEVRYWRWLYFCS